MKYAAIAALVMLVSAAELLAQPVIENVTPPFVQRGKKTKVTFHGQGLDSVQDVWHSGPTGSLKAKMVLQQTWQTVIEIDAAADAPIGMLGLRLASRDGLSNMHLFLIDDLPTSVWGTFREGAVDRYPLEVKAGQLVSFEVVASRFGKDADPLLTIKDAAGRFVADRDNDQGLYFDCRFAHRFEKTGKYQIEIRDSRFEGNPGHHYVLRMGQFPAARVVLPNAVTTGKNELTLPEMDGKAITVDQPNRLPGAFDLALRRPGDEGSTWMPAVWTDGAIVTAHRHDPVQAQRHNLAGIAALATGTRRTSNALVTLLAWEKLVRPRPLITPATIPGILSGVLDQPGQRQAFAFDLTKGQSIYVRAEAQSLQSPADLDVALTDATGREVRRATTDNKTGDISLEFTANNPGQYRLVVRDQLQDAGPAFTYRLTVRDRPFPPSLQAEVEGLTIPQGSYQPIPLAITGNKGPITLKLLGAPPGLRLEPTEISEKDTSVICKLFAANETPLGAYAVQILAETSAGPVLVRTLPLIDKQLINVDQIPLALRDDQKRLPASLTDRLAVQVMPPSPFTMELVDGQITLPRFQVVAVPIELTRLPGFTGSLSFTAKGGQIGDKNEGRTRVYAEFPNAGVGQSRVSGKIVSKILTNLAKARVEITGIGIHEGRRVQLTRTCDMTVSPAFSVKAEPAKISLLPGESTKIRFIAQRLPSFDGDITLNVNPMPTVSLPDRVTIAKGQDFAEIEIHAAPDALPRKQNLQGSVTGQVNGYEEETRGIPLEVEVRKK